MRKFLIVFALLATLGMSGDDIKTRSRTISKDLLEYVLSGNIPFTTLLKLPQ